MLKLLIPCHVKRARFNCTPRGVSQDYPAVSTSKGGRRVNDFMVCAGM
jgi:hypothetical protein